VKKLGVLIVIIGVLVFSYPWFLDYIYTPYFISKAQGEMKDIDPVTIISNNNIIEKSKKNKTLNDHIEEPFSEISDLDEEKLSSEDMEKNEDVIELENEDFFDFDQVEYVDASLKKYEVKYNYVIGWIQIPSVNLDLPIFYGVKNNHLFLGAGTMKPEQEMGEGNYALAGHDSRNSKLYFAPIHKIEVGSFIHISDGSYVYTYEVSKVFVVEATAVEVIEDRDTVDEITLVTCTDNGKRRLIVKGIFIEKVDGYHK
jgi:sortase A